MNLVDIASNIKATLVNVANKENIDIIGVAGIEDANSNQITFIANKKYTPMANVTNAGAIIVSPDFPQITIPTLRTKNPYFAFALAVELFYQSPQYESGIHTTAIIHPSAKIGNNAHIGAYVVIDADVKIGNNAILLSHVVIYRGVHIGNDFFAHSHAIVREYCSLGNHVTLQNSAIIGSDGFGFAKNDNGQWHKIVQSGITVIKDNVEVQANACVDRSTIGQTYIGCGVKIDNLVQIGHGSKIGENDMLCAQVGISGSTAIGANVILAGQVGIAGHCKIGDDVIVTAKSGVSGDIKSRKIVSGIPAIDNKLWLRISAAYKCLPEMIKIIRKLTKTLSIDNH
ncbi:MAG: UDP-3-O-(3-hydroxymyristoyl)glucosamine N-acyltransferase [Rhodospirillaceae bacterium]|jgi:UDP-3-O-[3-hydroxymyristoyl] glucosamine N-acyltransferase|nr:UDP-3-O-(3-hydroxymyristoyl)glucosamine N-acyltransferase [Rhodospirillaceae bacterium]